MPSERKKMQKVKKSDEDASLFLIYLGGGGLLGQHRLRYHSASCIICCIV